MKVYSVNCSVPLIAVKLTQVGKSTNNNYHLRFNAFDIFGKYVPFDS